MAGSPPKQITYINPDQTVAFNPRLYAQPAAVPSSAGIAARHPSEKEKTTVATTATRQATSSTRSDTAPTAAGLSLRPVAESRCASIRSLDHPIDNWPVSTANPSSTTRPAVSPTPTAIRTPMRVTAAVGAG